MLDPLIGQGPALVRQLASLYPSIIQRSRAAWGAVYHSSNTRPAFAAIRAVFGGQVRKILVEQLRRQDPDLVLSVHPLLNHVAYQAIASSRRRRPLMTVVTDLVDFHRGWAFPRADLVVVPSEGALEVVLKRRVPPSKVKLLGLPVDLRFRPPAPGEKQALRRRFGLAEDRMTVLVAGGGEGSGRMLQQVRSLAWQAHPWQVITVCGRNEKLRRRLARVNFGTPSLVLGFVNNMPELMRASDVVVTKAGPGAIAEALATEVPIILTGYLPGQETPNVKFVTDAGIGLYAPKPEQLREAVEHLLVGDPRELQAMAERAAKIGRPYASLDIAREALTLAAGAARQRAESHASR